MEDAVERGTGQDRIVPEDLAPLAKGFVACEHQRLPLLIAFGDELEEQAGVHWIEGEVANLIDDEELGLGKGGQLTVQAVLVDGFGEATGEVKCGGEVHAVPEFGSTHEQTDGQMCLPDPWWSQEDDVSTLGEEATGGKFINETPVEAGLGVKVKVGQRLVVRKIGELEVEGERLALPLGEFARQQIAQEVGIAPALGSSLLAGLIEMSGRRVEAQGGEGVWREVFVGLIRGEGAHETSAS